MTRLTYRRDLAQRLSVEQGDQNVDHLSRVVLTDAETQLFAGGRYLATGTCRLLMPTDGNQVTIGGTAGVVSLVGLTVGDAAATVVPTPFVAREYWLSGGVWRAQSESREAYVRVEGDVTVGTADRYWVECPADQTFVIPADSIDGRELRVVRQGTGSLTIETRGAERIRNPVTGALDTTAVMNDAGRELLLRLHGLAWEIAR